MQRLRLLPVVLLVVLAYAATQSSATFFLLTALLWLLAPGYLIERYVMRPARSSAPSVKLPQGQPLLVRIGVWLSLSQGVVALVYLWLTTMRLHWSPAAGYVASSLLAVGTAWYGLRDFQRRSTGRDRVEWWSYGSLGAILVLTGWTRWRQIDGLAFPPWVDAVHHAVMIQVVAERGQAPYSLRPYLPIDHFAYHWGYHAVAATIWQLGNLPLPTFMLWYGQLLQTLAVVAFAAVALALWRRPIAAVGTGLVVGLVSIMPAYYLSWGRYTLLAGLLMLPGVMIAAWEGRAVVDRRRVTLLALTLAGLNLVHFVVFAFALLWCGAVWLSAALPRSTRWSALWGGATAVVLALFITAPWMVLLIGQSMQAKSQSGPLSVTGGDYNTMPLDLLWTGNNRALAAVAGCGAALGLRRRQGATLAVITWSALVMVVANPVWFGLPYLSFFANRIVAIVAFAPSALLIGAGIAALSLFPTTGCRPPVPQFAGSRIGGNTLLGALGRPSRVGRAIAAVGLLSYAGYAARNMQSVVNPITIIGRPDDEAAIAWVAAHTPPTARFVVNTTGWLYNIPRGSDGGWWLLPIAGRQVSTPPVIANYGSPQYFAATQQVDHWLQDARAKSPEELASWMHDNDFAYVYATDDGPSFDPARLALSPRFQMVYHAGTITIFHRNGAG